MNQSDFNKAQIDLMEMQTTLFSYRKDNHPKLKELTMSYILKRKDIEQELDARINESLKNGVVSLSEYKLMKRFKK